MAKPLVSDELWNILQPLLPTRKPRRFRFPGRKPIDDRKALAGILFVLKTGIPWEDLPHEMGCGSGMTCWRRLQAWQCQGTRTFTRLRDTNLYEQDRQLRNTRSHFSLFPALPPFGSRFLLPAAAH